MKLVKSLLLGFTAGSAAVATAQAADLPMKKAAPVEYVRVCSSHGAGFFYIPGSDTCIKFGGRVRADYAYIQPQNGYFYAYNGLGNLLPFGRQGRYLDATGFKARARLDVDARTTTDYGTLRAFMRFQIDRNAGALGTGFGGPLIDKAFIQWAGITAGYAQSFFDFFASDLNWGSFGGSPGSDTTSNLLAYTATFGSGFSLTVSVEDRNIRQLNPFNINYLGFVTTTLDTAGQRIPDVVGVLRVDQDWGSAQLSGASHQLNSGVLYGPWGQRVDSKYGWAVQGGVKFNMPFLAKGDVLWLQAAYANGAASYLGLNNVTNVGRSSVFAADGIIAFNNIKTSTGWNITAAGLHYWTPSVRSTLWGSYTDVQYDHVIRETSNALRDFNVFQVGSALIWSPVSKFDIGVEVLYGRAERNRHYGDFAFFRPFAPFLVKRSEDQVQTRLRLQRDF